MKPDARDAWNQNASWTAIPTWLIVNITIPFLPKTHVWKGRWFGLRDWHDHRTMQAVQCDFMAWITAVTIVTVAISLGAR